MSNYIIDPFQTFGPAPPPLTRNAWVEIGRTKLVAPSRRIEVPIGGGGGLPNKRYYMALVYITGALTATNKYWITGNVATGGYDDITNNPTIYSIRESVDGGAELTNSGGSVMIAGQLGGVGKEGTFLGVAYFDNNPIGEKLVVAHATSSNVAGVLAAGNVPQRSESVSKWQNALNPMDRLACFSGTLITNDFGIGSEVVVLGFDPADGGNATQNFWQPLGTATNNGTTLDLTFAAKKYLWVQMYVKRLSATYRTAYRFNNDSGVKYAQRESSNGGADTTSFAATELINTTSSTFVDHYADMFISNELNDEKLVINHLVEEAAGLQREEAGQKYIDPAQITRITIFDQLGPGTIDPSSTFRVWGHD